MKDYYATLTTATGERIQGIYSPDEFHALTFHPATKINFLTSFSAKSKPAARDLIMNIIRADCETVDAGGEMLSWKEAATLYDKIEKLARRFGLIKELRANGIL